MIDVSVLLPVRNGGAYIDAALRSVLQTRLALEVIVIDDGSTDDTNRILAGIDDSRVRVVRTMGLGVAAALNVGLAEARGRYVARQDADDLSLEGRLDAQASYLDSHADIDIVSCLVTFIDDAGTTVDTTWTRQVRDQWERAQTADDIAAMLPLTCCLVHGSVMLRREVLQDAGGYNAALPVAQDYDLWLRLLPNHRFARLGETLYAFRLHGGQTSATRGSEQARLAIAAKLRYLQPYLRSRQPAVRIIGAGVGANFYRAALRASGWRETESTQPDLFAFTNFGTLEADMCSIRSASNERLTRIGNFLVATP